MESSGLAYLFKLAIKRKKKKKSNQNKKRQAIILNK